MVVLVSDSLARELWGSPQAALGKRIGFFNSFREVIGVVQDVYDNGVQEPAPSSVYWPAFGPNFFPGGPLSIQRNVTFTLRSSRTGTAEFLRQIEQAVWSVNPNLSAAALQSMAELHNRSLARTSFTLVMLAIAGGMALVLGVIGIYGVLAYTVAQRRREVGIRLALGAKPREVQQMFVSYGLRLAAVGIAIGLVAAGALSRVLQSLLFGITPLDPPTYVTTVLVLMAASVVASYLPARKASRVDPAETLRGE
jgi:ABC-type antimicrobial peptide transport system permease subunit